MYKNKIFAYIINKILPNLEKHVIQTMESTRKGENNDGKLPKRKFNYR